MTESQRDFIGPDQVPTLAHLFRERVRRSAERVAYRYFDPAQSQWRDLTWQDMEVAAGRWQQALRTEGLKPGDRVGIMLRNCPEWVLFDQAALGLGLVVVPLFVNDRSENAGYILRHAGVRLLLLGGTDQWHILEPVRGGLRDLQRIVSVDPVEARDRRLVGLAHWLPRDAIPYEAADLDPRSLATICYTSGTTGRPKGVMLSHRNILWNAWVSAQCGPVGGDDCFLSFLPLSHMFERTGGYYLPMVAGVTVAYARSVQDLAEDLVTIKPTHLMAVPRIFERVYRRIQEGLAAKSPAARRLFQTTLEVGWARFEHAQGRGGWRPDLLLWPILRRLVADKVLARLGGRVKLAICGGAALPEPVSRLFIGLGLPLVQGYGLTEAAPVISANRLERNMPASVGEPVPGLEVRVAENDELWVRSPGVMLGYWQDRRATETTVTQDGWLRTGDQVRVNEGHIVITGRLKDVIVLANGEKVAPADVEMAVQQDPLLEQVMIIGEGRPYLCALAVVSPEAWPGFAKACGVDPANPDNVHAAGVERAVLERIDRLMAPFPGHAEVRRVYLDWDAWSIENGLLTPTLKLRRKRIEERHAVQIDAMYEGH